MINSNEQHWPTEQELINSGLADYQHILPTIQEHETKLKQIEEIKKVFWNKAKQVLENSGSEVQATERLGNLTKATLIDINLIFNK